MHHFWRVVQLTLYRICSNNDYKFEDLANQNVCNVHETDSIYDSIIEYNKGKKSCLEKMREEKIRTKERQNDPKYKAKLFRSIWNYAKVVGDSAATEDIVTLLADKKITDPVEDADQRLDGNLIQISDIEPESIIDIMKDVENC